MTGGPLGGCRVIELAHIMAGPVCGLMLADLGADVIKVEKPAGDDTRRAVPPEIAGESAAYMMMNRNKRGIVLDLKTDGGRDALGRLLQTADVVIENYRRGTMERLGFGYEALKIKNPGLIYVAISGFGRAGPYADRAGFDLIAQGMSGLMSITGEGEGRPPVKVGAPITDITAGILAALGVVSAYVHKLRTGKGQIVDTSLLEAGITQTYWQSAITFASGLAPGPMGSAHPLNAPYQAFATSDGWINVGAANQKNWTRFAELIEAPALTDDRRFVDNAARMANRDALAESIEVILRTKTTAHWLDVFERGGLPAGPVLAVDQMHRDPQTIAREMVPTVTHPLAGAMQTIGLPIKLSETPGGVRRAAPLLGEHTAEVLSEAGFDKTDVAWLLDQRAAVQAAL